MDDSTCFSKNLSCLRKNHPEIFEMVRSSSRSIPTTRFDDSSNLLGAIHTAIERGVDFYYVLGIGDGNWLEPSAKSIARDNRGIVVIEPILERFIAVLHQQNFVSWFRSGKVFWAIGPHYEQALQRIWERTLCCLATKPGFFYLSSSDFPEERAKLEIDLAGIRAESLRRKSLLAEQLKNLPSLLPTGKNRAKRIWTFDDFRGKARFSTIQQVLIRNLFYGLRKLGYETEYTVLCDGYYYPPYYRILKMAQFEPDLLFFCNQGSAYEMALGAELSRSLKIPKVIWFADDPVYAEHLLLRHKTSPDETYLVADHEWGEPLVENGADPPGYMPGAVTRTRRGKKRASRRCDLVFVGQIRDQRAFFAALSPGWRDYCERVIREKLRFPRKKVREVMAQFPSPGLLEADRMDELRQAVLWEANTRFRVSMVTALAEYDLRIYGNEAWKVLLPSSIAERSCRGVLRFKHLFEVYRNARITLNIHSLQSYTCLNVRDFDVPAAGGFLLSDWLPRADEIFVPGFIGDLPVNEDSDREVFFYRTVLELKKLIEYFLANQDHRQACVDRARQRVLSEHTYTHRAQQLDAIFQRLLSA